MSDTGKPFKEAYVRVTSVGKMDLMLGELAKMKASIVPCPIFNDPFLIFLHKFGKPVVDLPSFCLRNFERGLLNRPILSFRFLWILWVCFFGSFRFWFF